MTACRTTRCSCEDAGLHTPCPSCEQGTFECPDLNPCAENFSDKCIIHTGDPIVEFNIQTGDSVELMLSKIMSQLQNPDCFLNGLMPVNVKMLAVSAYAVKIGWEVMTQADFYQVSFSDDEWATSNVNPILAGTYRQDIVTGLTPETEYQFRVTANPEDGDGACTSLTIIVTTLAETT